MILISVSNPVWVDSEHTMIDCLITTSERGDQQIPFTASADDVEAHGRAIFADLVAGRFGPIGEYVPPVLSDSSD